MRIWFSGAEGAVATVIAISESDYTLASYSSAEQQRSGSPASQWTLTGTPNSTDILAALGDGWADESDGLPAERAIPKAISARQVRLWLVRHGFALGQVDDAISAIADEQTRSIVRIEWDHAPYIERTHPWLIPLAESLGLTSDQVDDAFREAATI